MSPQDTQYANPEIVALTCSELHKGSQLGDATRKFPT